MTTSPAAVEDRLDFKKILPIFVIVLIDLMGLTIIIPLLPLYAASFGASAVAVGALGATYPVAQFFGAPLLGRASDRYGRRPVLLISQLGTLIGFLILGFAPSLGWLFLSRLIDGLSGGNIATAQAVITDNTTERTRTQGLGLIGAAFGLGFIVGPVIAFLALAIGKNNYAVPAFVAAGFSLVSILLTWFWLEESHPPEKRGKAQARSPFTLAAMLEALRHPAVGVLLVLMFAQQLAFGGFEQILSLFTLTTLGLGARGNAVLFVFVGVIVVMVQGYFIGRWSRKLGDRRLIYLGLAALALGLALTAATPNQPPPFYNRAQLEAELQGGRQLPGETPPVQGVAAQIPDDSNTGWLGLAWLLVAMIPTAIGGGVLQPSINSLITKRVNDDERGGILGISAAFLSGANAIAPVIGGSLFALSANLPFWVWSAFIAVLLVVALRSVTPGREEGIASVAAA